MHRGIAKRISDRNTLAVMREIKLASPLYHEQVPHAYIGIHVTPKWIKYFSSALINSWPGESVNVASFVTGDNSHVESHYSLDFGRTSFTRDCNSH